MLSKSSFETRVIASGDETITQCIDVQTDKSGLQRCTDGFCLKIDNLTKDLIHFIAHCTGMPVMN